MAAFYRFQRVRIVRMGGCQEGVYPQYIGSECVLMDAVELQTAADGPWVAGWETNIPHPYSETDNLCVAEGDIEPLRYLPDAEDLATQERAPEWSCPLPHEIGAA